MYLIIMMNYILSTSQQLSKRAGVKTQLCRKFPAMLEQLATL